MKRRYSISDEINDLYISVYLVGYEREGESCIFVLYTKEPEEKVLYTIVIDCYEQNNINHTMEILKKIHKNRKLDMLIWTHPHDDHSIGLDKIISKMCNKETKIITAEILNSKLPRYSNVSDSLIQYITGLNKGKDATSRWDISSLAHFPETLQEVQFTKGKNVIEKMIIRCISPHSNVGNVQAGLKNEKINKLSVGITVEIIRRENRLNFLFAGDMEKQTIDALLLEQEDEEIPAVYNYIKIPHHGSQNSSNLVDMLDEACKSELGCFTVFCDTDLPRREAIKMYSNCIENLHCTSNVDKKKFGIGIIKVDYDIKREKYSLEHFGTAAEIII